MHTFLDTDGLDVTLPSVVVRTRAIYSRFRFRYASRLRFLCSPFSVEAFSDLEKLKVDRHKIASGETTNFLLLDLMAKSGKPLLLSSGMSSFDELDKTIERIDSNKGNIEALFQCTTAYPTPAEKLG